MFLIFFHFAYYFRIGYAFLFEVVSSEQDRYL